MSMKSALFLSAAIVAMPIVVASANAAPRDPAPVEFATDPGEAHPKNLYSEVAIDEMAAPRAEKAAMMREEAIKDAELERVAIASQDSGQFDYGYASTEIELRDAQVAQAGPTVLLDKKDVQPAVISTVSAPKTSGNPYYQDPLYSIAGSSNEATVEVAYRPQANAQSSAIAIVEPGDTVYALGRKYAVSPKEIIALNNLAAPYPLEIGQKILIPIEMKQSVNQQAAMPQTPAAQPTPKAVAQTVQYTAPATNHITYTVQAGDTLYSLSRRSGQPLTAIASLNNIPEPYTLSIGQQLLIPNTVNVAATTPTPATPLQGNRNTYIDPAEAQNSQWITTQPATAPQVEANIAKPDPKSVAYPTKDLDSKALGASRFGWPVQGQVVMNFGLDAEGRRNDGINIAAPIGTPVRTVADGEVVYRGSDLDGYGNLLLIKHADGWVSAYAHTDAMLVRKGEQVKKGQIIAKVGATGAVAQPQLHFELRYNLKPTDPLAALEGRNELALQNVSLSQ